MRGEVAKMIGVGLVWGATNAIIRRGAVLWDQNLRRDPPSDRRSPPLSTLRRISGGLRRWIDLMLIWQYSIPLLVNLSASAAFFYVLGGSPISVTVPVTNATTFAATAVSAAVLGEEIRIGRSLLGTALIVLGVWICIT